MMERARLKDVAAIVTGSTPATNTPAFFGGDCPFVTPSELDGANPIVTTPTTLSMQGVAQVRVVPKNTVLVCCIGSLGKTGIAGVSLATNQQINAVVFDESKVLPRYGLHCCRLLKPVMEHMAPATTIKIVNKSRFSDLTIPVPPLSEQRHIADILDKADELRAKRRASLEQLNGLTQSMFLEMFGDPATNPMGWPNRTLGGTLAFQQYGPRFFNEPYNLDGIRIVRISDLNEDGTLDFSGMPRLNVSDEDRQKYQLKSGDVVFARSGATVGKVALIQPDDPPCIAGAYFITMRFQDVIVPVYARAVLTTPSVRAIVSRRSRQAAQQNFSGPGLRALPMPVPPLTLQQRFARQVAAVENISKAIQRFSMTGLDELFASLQHQAFSGAL